MRIAIVNACSPEMPHVCAVRARTFAAALCRMGEAVLLVTPPPYETGPGTPPEDISRILTDHSTGAPRHIALPHRTGSALPAVRSGSLPPFRRRLRIAAEFTIRGHVYGDWISGGHDTLQQIASEYRPDIVWAIFGNMGCWAMGRALAKQSGCPWIGDVKDSWESFVPAGFRQLTAWRFSDAAALTALSIEHAKQTRHFSQGDLTVIRSGIEQESPRLSATAQPVRTIVLSGSLYDPARIREFVSSLCRWQSATAPSMPVRLVYAGGDTDLFETAVPDPADLSIDIDIKGALSSDELMSLQSSAWANGYISNAPNLFHHKLLELLIRNRPVIAYPGETRESAEISRDFGVTLCICRDQADLSNAFEKCLGIEEAVFETPDPAAVRRMSIETQADRLLSVFARILEARRQ